MALLNGFSDPVTDAQQSFRAILTAMSEPGHLVTLNTDLCWPGLSPAACAVLLTLSDHDTPLYLAPSFCQTTLQENLRFHTGAVLTQDASHAAYALLDADFSPALLRHFSIGSTESPDQSTTVIMALPDFNGGHSMTLSGPGIKTTRTLSAQLPEALIHYLCHRPTHFPQGLDFIFTCGEQLLAIPRTTQVEVN
ncbi:phosphonate C-P lyase system protein PhnH [Samsonia erythrinae]|uniref:Methylphosphonate degradation complex subunit PhnH n=1 Tax=Samsonia erythrinae TaxID=160434 RepID=A0A4R3VS23_9GAMM|nr:phosphonate C-P lyase system protein PhnH [Samsonia erythrinae]TCV08611.1 methylphosphonate degradation complex subunit PhnH [Samsonia erythrinae]